MWVKLQAYKCKSSIIFLSDKSNSSLKSFLKSDLNSVMPNINILTFY